MTTEVSSLGPSPLEALFVSGEALVHSVYLPSQLGTPCRRRAHHRRGRRKRRAGGSEWAEVRPVCRDGPCVSHPCKMTQGSLRVLTVALRVGEGQMLTLAESLVTHIFNSLLLQKRHLTHTCSK